MYTGFHPESNCLPYNSKQPTLNLDTVFLYVVDHFILWCCEHLRPHKLDC